MSRSDSNEQNRLRRVFVRVNKEKAKNTFKTINMFIAFFYRLFSHVRVEKWYNICSQEVPKKTKYCHFLTRHFLLLLTLY